MSITVAADRSVRRRLKTLQLNHGLKRFARVVKLFSG